MKKKEKKTSVNKAEGNLQMPLYELNKTLIGQLPQYNQSQLNDLQDRINDWEDSQYKYYMLLCNDYHYYTVLVRTQHNIAHFPDLGQAITGLLSDGFTIHSDENCTDHFEIWVKKNDATYVFLLFPYDQGVVNYG